MFLLVTVIMDHRNKSGTALSSKKKKKAKAAEEEDSDEVGNGNNV